MKFVKTNEMASSRWLPANVVDAFKSSLGYSMLIM